MWSMNLLQKKLRALSPAVWSAILIIIITSYKFVYWSVVRGPMMLISIWISSVLQKILYLVLIWPWPSWWASHWPKTKYKYSFNQNNSWCYILLFRSEFLELAIRIVQSTNLVREKIHWCSQKVAKGCASVFDWPTWSQNHIPYERHYNTRLEYFLPNFSVQFLIKNG